MFIDSLNHYITNQEPTIMAALSGYQQGLLLAYPRKPLTPELFLKSSTRALQYMKQELKTYDYFKDYKREFPKSAIICYGVHSRACDVIFKEFDVEEEDLIAFDISTLTETARNAVNKEMQEYNDLRGILRNILEPQQQQQQQP